MVYHQGLCSAVSKDYNKSIGAVSLTDSYLGNDFDRRGANTPSILSCNSKLPDQRFSCVQDTIAIQRDCHSSQNLWFEWVIIHQDRNLLKLNSARRCDSLWSGSRFEENPHRIVRVEEELQGLSLLWGSFWIGANTGFCIPNLRIVFQRRVLRHGAKSILILMAWDWKDNTSTAWRKCPSCFSLTCRDESERLPWYEGS